MTTLEQTIHEASRTLTPLEQNIDSAGPGGESYDLAPTPRLTAVVADSSEEKRKRKLVVLSIVLVTIVIGGLTGHFLRKTLHQRI